MTEPPDNVSELEEVIKMEYLGPRGDGEFYLFRFKAESQYTSSVNSVFKGKDRMATFLKTYTGHAEHDIEALYSTIARLSDNGLVGDCKFNDGSRRNKTKEPKYQAPDYQPYLSVAVPTKLMVELMEVIRTDTIMGVSNIHSILNTHKYSTGFKEYLFNNYGTLMGVGLFFLGIGIFIGKSIK